MAVANHSNNSFAKRRWLRYFWAWRQLAIAVAVPLLLLPLVFCFEDDPALKNPMRCAYVLIIMILFWSTEALPLPMTGLVPMLGFPILQLVPATMLAPRYLPEPLMSFVGTAAVISAFERVELHKRLALRFLTLIGTKPRWLLLAFMLESWFLTMWTSNLVATMLLVPIALSVVVELRSAVDGDVLSVSREEEVHVSLLNSAAQQRVEQVAEDNFNVIPKTAPAGSRCSFEDSSSLLGSTATTIGGAPNLIMKHEMDNYFQSKGCPSPLSFLNWMLFSVPMSLLFLFLMWLWLMVYFISPQYAFGCKTSPLDAHHDKIRRNIRRIYDALAPMAAEQVVVLAHCIALILLLVTRQLSTSPLIGWELIAPGFVKESTATILVAFSLFLFPITLPSIDDETGKLILPQTAVKWKDAEKTFPFGLLLIAGGGIAAAFGAEVSGLAALISNQLNSLVTGLSDLSTLLVLIVFMVAITEVLTNVACVTLTMNIFKQLAEYRGSNPLLFIFPTTLAASFAFMLPAGTPPNAIIFQTGYIKMREMAAVGFVNNLLGVGILYLATVTYGVALFRLLEPAWTVSFKNSTITYYNCTFQ